MRSRAASLTQIVRVLDSSHQSKSPQSQVGQIKSSKALRPKKAKSSKQLRHPKKRQEMCHPSPKASMTTTLQCPGQEATKTTALRIQTERNKIRKIEGSRSTSSEQYAHVKSGVVHVLSGSNFVCGRPNSDRYIKVDSRRDAYRVTCQGCFKTQHINS